ncbi:uncharacterized protein LOC132700893 [Cylas formicarius]|uniref:uncharacterized protein LOC132700893 n=1 Tax=Cylas formicarius TaxID=197179 RepID=UPI00295881F5|nr:uncharacterized protein LOC132700893 [Cylas formicarius]
MRVPYSSLGNHRYITVLGQLYVTPATPTENDWDIFSVSLRFLLPLAGLGIVWIRRNAFAQLWMHLDRTCVSVFLPSLSHREKLLKWARDRLPNQWSSPRPTLSGGVSDLWYDGSLLCAIVNTAVPGACSNPHKHWKKPPAHAQELAFKYLGVIPIFAEADLHGPLNAELEQNFLRFLCLLRKAVDGVTQSRPTVTDISKAYIARGMGLYAGEQYKESVFYIYPQINPCYYYNIGISVKGPYSTHGRIEFSQMCPDSPTTYQNQLVNPNADTTGLAKVCSTSESDTDIIKIKVTIESARARIAFIPKSDGIHEVSIESNSEPIIGSPYYVNVFQAASSSCNSKNASRTRIKRSLLVELAKENNMIDRNPIDEQLGCYIKNLNLSSFDDDSMNLKNIKPNNKDFKNLCNITKKSISNSLVDKFLEKKNFTHFPVKINMQASCDNEEVAIKPNPVAVPSSLSTSPICSDHIAPEDDGNNQASLKGRCSANQHHCKQHSSDNGQKSSYSTNENIRMTKGDTDKRTDLIIDSNKYAPSSHECHEYQTCLHKEKSSSMTNLSYHPESLGCCLLLKRLNAHTNLSKSQADLRSRPVPPNIKKYKSMDHSLDACSEESIEKRRLDYLKQTQFNHIECGSADSQEEVKINSSNTDRSTVQFVEGRGKVDHLTFKEARNYFKFLEENAKKPFRTIIELDKFVYSKDRMWYQTINSCRITRTNRLKANQIYRNALTMLQKNCHCSSVDDALTVISNEDANFLKESVMKFAKQKKRHDLKSVFGITY